MQTQEMDTFGDMSPIEAVAAPVADSTGGGAELDTFSDGPDFIDLPKEEEKAEIKDETKTNQTEQLDDQEEIEGKKEEKEEVKEEVKEEAKEEIEEVKEEKLEGKSIRLKEGDS